MGTGISLLLTDGGDDAGSGLGNRMARGGEASERSRGKKA
jgi:hypothetical protein